MVSRSPLHFLQAFSAQELGCLVRALMLINDPCLPFVFVGEFWSFRKEIM